MGYVPPLYIKTTYYEDDDITTMFRPRHADGSLVVLSMVDEWDLFVYDQKDNGTPLTPLYSLTAQSPVGIMFATAQTPAGGDSWWDDDPDGYTFRHTLEYADRTAATFFMEGGKNYVLEYVLHLSAGGRINGIHITPIKSVRHE